MQEELSVGTRVWLENTAQKQRKGGKMDPVWLGPYTINKSLGKGLYELKNDTGEILKKKANVIRLKLYVSRDPAKRKILTKLPKEGRQKTGEVQVKDLGGSVSMVLSSRSNTKKICLQIGCEIKKFMYHKADIHFR